MLPWDYEFFECVRKLLVRYVEHVSLVQAINFLWSQKRSVVPQFTRLKEAKHAIERK